MMNNRFYLRNGARTVSVPSVSTIRESVLRWLRTNRWISTITANYTMSSWRQCLLAMGSDNKL